MKGSQFTQIINPVEEPSLTRELLFLLSLRDCGVFAHLL